ncbi:anti-sigma factor family protein [Catenulispora subtropica]|uniref:Putative zinc-finger domain-containing protein n=1 Tax=Catenulispora subtropica TaxID=450798 RepID=A0ABP5DX19_9ACTN
MTRHLGDRLTALIDGELDHGTRDRMLGHLAQCDDCRREADAERRVKARLGALDGPQVPVELMLGLLSMDTNRGASAGAGAAPGSGQAGQGGVGGGPAPFSFQTVPIRPPAAPASGRPTAGRAPVRPQRLRAAAIGAVSLAAIGTGVWLVGDFSGGAGGAAHTPAPAAPAQVATYGPGH